MNIILDLVPYLLFLPPIQCFTLSIRSQDGSSSKWVNLRTQPTHYSNAAIDEANRKHFRIRPFPPNTRNEHYDISPSIILYASLSADEQKRQSSSPDTTSSIYTSAEDAITEQTSEERQVESPLPPTDMIVKLQSYIMNIRRTRPRKQRGEGLSHDNDNQYRSGSSTILEESTTATHKMQLKEYTTREEDRITIPPPHSTSNCRKTIDSLLYTLQNQSKCHYSQASVNSYLHSSSIISDEDEETKNTSAPSTCHTILTTNEIYMEWRRTFNQAIIYAIRAAADFGNYILISNILDSAIEYSNSIVVELIDHDHIPASSKILAGDDENDIMNTNHHHLLEPRVFGEAIVEMTRTKANMSKIKKIWSKLLSPRIIPTLASSPTAFELNAMSMALASRQNLRAALDLYKEFDPYHQGNSTTNTTMTIESDTYTAGILCNILEDSIVMDEIDASSKTYPKTTYSKRQRQSLCWQWTEVESILDDFQRLGKLNNNVYSLALKVNTKAAASFTRPGRRHLGAKFAMGLLERMKRDQVSPDVVTCSAVMSAFDRGYQWKAALSLLRSMEKSSVDNSNSTGITASTSATQWKLPPPNVYTYAIAASSCARCGFLDEALTVLESLRQNPSEDTKVNVWVYNSVLSAFEKTKFAKYKSSDDGDSGSDHVQTVLNVLDWMKEDAKKGCDTMPDTVTYNIVISTMQGDDAKSTDVSTVQDEGYFGIEMITSLLDEMKINNIQRDSITYRNAIIACKSNTRGALQVLQRAFDDVEFMDTLTSAWGSTSKGKEYLIHTAMSVAAKNGDMVIMKNLFDWFKVQNIQASASTMSHLLKSLWVSNNCEDLMITLNAMKGDMAANQIISEKFDIDILQRGIEQHSPMIEEYHYSSAINGCLAKKELFLALKILHAMRLHDLVPNESSLQRIILAYCKLATDAARQEFSIAKEQSFLHKKNKSAYSIWPKHVTSKARAKAALEMMKSLDEPQVKVQSAVSSACAAAGMWKEARDILWSMHIQAMNERKHQTPFDSVHDSLVLKELPKLHHSLLKLCARSGNVTAALTYADAIQDLSSKLLRGKKSSVSTHILSQGNDLGNANVSAVMKSVDGNEDDSTSTKNSTTIGLVSSFSHSSEGIGMTGEDWKLLMIAASKSGHWKVCLGTLQFIKPFVEETHPRNILEPSTTTPIQSTEVSMEHHLQKQYDGLARALTAATLSFEVRSQYAWAVRSIDDWIEWSGRRPPREAVHSVCRILGARGLGNQITNIIGKVLAIPPSVDTGDESNDIFDGSTSYETSIYIEAITILYKNGLYDNADELYAKAISNNHLPWAVMGEENIGSELKLDLHGMSIALAHSAVRVSLQHISSQSSKDVLIITGRGNKSLQRFKPVLRPEVQRMLVEEFYPPLGTFSVPGNMGALRVPSKDIESWIDHQQREKGARFLLVADVLKSLSTGSRLKFALNNQLSTKKEDSSIDDNKQ